MSLDAISYENVANLSGNASSRMVYVCEANEVASAKALLLGALDANDTNLMCYQVRSTYYKGDAVCGLFELTADFMPKDKIEAKKKDVPFKYRLSWSGQSFTVSGKAWKWAGDSKPIKNQNILPTKQCVILEGILYGTRDTVNFGTYASYMDTVNSDTFLGAPAGTVKFEGASATPRMTEAGTVVNDVELKFLRRDMEWNKFYNEDTGSWDYIQNGSTKVYPAVAYSGLLT